MTGAAELKPEPDVGTERPDRSDEVIVHARGRMTAADHVHARDRIVQLRRLIPNRSFKSIVRIVVDDGSDGLVSTSGEIHLDGHVLRARAEGTTIRSAIAKLEQWLREGIEAGAPDDDEAAGRP